MSKRPLFRPPSPAKAPSCLDFTAWKAQQRHDGGEQHDNGKAYEPSSEDLPDKLWYSLDLDLLRKNIGHMCNDLGRPVAVSTIVDHEISDLRRTLAQATSIPRPKRIIIAVVGNQGMGKSSTINALLNRNLVEVLGGSEACTAFATIIEYKEGTADDTTLSDIKVVFLSLDEIRDFIEEHIRRYATFITQSGDDEEDELDAEDSDGSVQESAREERRTISKAVQQGADTADEFFKIMFNADSDESGKYELGKWLKEPDLEDGRFLDRLMQLATDHVSQIQDREAGSLEYAEVDDKSLEDVRSWAVKMWPLVKSVTISTGSVLLRQGICFMDLPGYGDLNQTRTAVVNQFRRQANFEIIVTTSDRYLTKTDENRYLTRAIRQQGAEDVFLVLNKIDSYSLLPPNEIKQKLRKREYKMEPFLSIDKNLTSMAKSFSTDLGSVAKYQRYLLREAQMAFCQYECDKIAQKLRNRGVQVFPISAGQYRQWIDPERLQKPSYRPKETGIPQLRQALLTIPATVNYEDLSTHVFETFSDIEDKVSRIVEKFTDDDMVTEIRRHLLDLLPALGRGLKDLALTLPEELVSLAWDDAHRSSIADGMATTIKDKQQNTYYQTFSLMLRNNGFANGSERYSHKNVNKDLLEAYMPQMKDWKNKTMVKANDMYTAFDVPVQDPLRDVQRILGGATDGDQALKMRTDEEFKKLNRRIDVARGRLLSRLQGAVNENYRYFTTEDDIKCPIALEMKSAYTRIHDIRKGQGRRPGIYAQQRAELVYTVNKSNEGKPALIDAIPTKVKSRQCEKWQAISENFIIDILTRFKDFARIMQDLLENETYMSDEHKMIRKKLLRQLPSFKKSLEQVTGMFPDAEAQQAAKKTRHAGPPGSARFAGFRSSQIKRE